MHNISFVNVFEQFLRAFSRLVQKLFSTEKKSFLKPTKNLVFVVEWTWRWQGNFVKSFLIFAEELQTCGASDLHELSNSKALE